MKKYLDKLPKQIQDLIYAASDIGHKNNMPVYLVGGFVRDLILGVPNLDLDIVIEGDGINFASLLCARLNGKLTRHRRFGTATVVTAARLKIDIATARRESYDEPAALPRVVPGALIDDLKRRDFSVNAVAISISRHDFGVVLDTFGGREDILHKKIRVLHDLSFIDDPTRIFRAIRFEQRFNFAIEHKTLLLIKDSLFHHVLERLQKQRLRDEIIIILKEPQPIKYIKRINELVGLSFITPGLKITARGFNFLKSIEKTINWYNKECMHKRSLDIWLMYWIGLLDGLSAHTLKKICADFVFRKGEEIRILSFEAQTNKIIAGLSKKSIANSAIFKLLEPLSYEVILLIMAKANNRVVGKHVSDFLHHYNSVQLHITGDDLKSIGVKPSPRFKDILRETLYAKIDGKIHSRQDELAFIKKKRS